MTALAMVGCAHIHTPRFVEMMRERSDIDVMAVWDHDAQRSARTAAKLGAASVSDLVSVWSDDRIEAVVICAESVRHPELVRAAVGARKHLFVEKPLAITGTDARELAAMIDASGLIYSTGFFKRGQGMYRYLRDRIAEGAFGQLTRIDLSIAHAGVQAGWFDTEWRWLADPSQAGYGGFGDLGIHAVDLILWLLGYSARPRGVMAWTGTAIGRYGTIDEFGRGQLAFSDGLVASVWASWADLANPVELVISGTTAHASIIDGHLTLRHRDTSAADEVDGSDIPSDLPHAFDLFLDAIAGDSAAALVAPAEAAICSAIIEALYRAAHEDGWVGIDQD